MNTETQQQTLKYTDFWNPERKLSIGELYRLRDYVIDTNPEIYEESKWTFDKLDHIYLQTVIKPNIEMFPVFMFHLDRIINDLKMIIPDIETKIDKLDKNEIACVFYRKASFLKWIIKEIS